MIALYFAVSDITKAKVDGELWVMFPEALNKLSGSSGFHLPRSPLVKYLAAEPAWSNVRQLADELGLEKPPNLPIPLLPPFRIRRMAAQMSMFTIHPAPTEENTIPRLLTEENDLVRCTIPADKKKKLWRDLMSLGISRRALFPDLDGLSQFIVEALKIGVDIGSPAPPCEKDGN